MITSIIKGMGCLATLAASLLTSQLNADTLRFTSGVVSNYSGVTLSLAGPTNLVCQVERLNPTNDTWQVQGNVTLGTNGLATYNSSLAQGIYGFFRAKSTNNSYYSTNGFGAVAGYIAPGDTLIGNSFASRTLTNFLTQPIDGLTAYQWDAVSNAYNIATYFAEDGAWDNLLTVGQCEALYIKNSSSNTVRYLTSGLFNTNAITTLLRTNYNLVSTPLYHLNPTNTWRVDTLSSNLLGGNSLLPVRTTGYSNECTISQLLSDATYRTFNLTNGVWKTGGTNTTIQINITEGFWVNKPTNATWTVNLPLW